MRWKNKGPKAGDRRTIKRFAFLPTPLDDGITVWLEQYYVKQGWYYKRQGWITILTRSVE